MADEALPSELRAMAPEARETYVQEQLDSRAKLQSQIADLSGRRDAWFVGGVGSVVTVVWVGLDDAGRLGLSGAAAAASIWKRYMTTAAVSPVESQPGLRLRFVRRGRTRKEVIR